MLDCDWSSDVCSSDLPKPVKEGIAKADAEAALKKLLDAGAKAELK
jgi:ribosomal protein L7/L12